MGLEPTPMIVPLFRYNKENGTLEKQNTTVDSFKLNNTTFNYFIPMLITSLHEQTEYLILKTRNELISNFQMNFSKIASEVSKTTNFVSVLSAQVNSKSLGNSSRLSNN